MVWILIFVIIIIINFYLVGIKQCCCCCSDALNHFTMLFHFWVCSPGELFVAGACRCFPNTNNQQSQVNCAFSFWRKAIDSSFGANFLSHNFNETKCLPETSFNLSTIFSKALQCMLYLILLWIFHLFPSDKPHSCHVINNSSTFHNGNCNEIISGYWYIISNWSDYQKFWLQILGLEMIN